MRTLMMLASILVVGAGTFCIANMGVPFISVAFIVGIAVMVMGICELVVNRMAVMRSYETTSEVNIEGLTAVILGVVFISGQITEGVALTTLFALWTTIEGLKAFSTNDGFSFKINLQDTGAAMTKALGVVMTVFGAYMFFNTRLLNIKVLALVGVSLFLIGLSRFRIALAIEYVKPDFLTGNKERLEEAKRDRTRAMQKAKEGIRETKEAEARIAKAEEAIKKEASMVSGTEKRRRLRN